MKTELAIKKPIEPIAKTLLCLLKRIFLLKRIVLFKRIVFAFDSRDQSQGTNTGACTGLVN